MPTYLSEVILPEAVRPAGPAKDTIYTQLNRLSTSLSKSKNKSVQKWLKENENFTEFSDTYELMSHIKKVKDIINRTRSFTKVDERCYLICCALLFRLSHMQR